MSPDARPSPRYLIRAPDGEELVCPSLPDLVALYRQGFLADDDLVRQEQSARWVRAGDMPALHGSREERRDPRRALFLLVTLALLVLAGLLGVRMLQALP